MLLPLVANVLHNLNLGPFGRVEPTPFLFVLTGTVLVWGIFRFHLLDLAPIARSSVLETIQDGVVVLDPYRRVVNLNPAAERALGMRTAEAVGRQAETLLAVAPSVLDGEAPEQVVLGDRQHELTTAPLRDRGGHETGRVVMLRDMTERQRAHERLVRLDEQRRWLLGRLVSRQERERRQLASNLRRVDPRLRTAASSLDRLRAGLDRPDLVELVEGLRGAITDSLGRLQEVRGPGVVGEEPVLAPSESFEYTSSCPLQTPSGFMVGDYEMETRSGERFLARVPAFSLDIPPQIGRAGNPEQRPLRLN